MQNAVVVAVLRAFVCSAIPPSELGDLVDRVDQFNARPYSAVFTVVEHYHPTVLDAETLHKWPEFKATGNVSCRVEWARDGVLWRHNVVYSLSDKLQELGQHFDSTTGSDGTRCYKLIHRARSLNIGALRADERPYHPTPDVEQLFHRPLGRLTLREYLDKGQIESALATENGDVLLTLATGAPTTVFRMTIAPRFEHSCVQWEMIDNTGRSINARCNMDYARRDSAFVMVAGRYVQYGKLGNGTTVDPYHRYDLVTEQWTVGNPASEVFSIPAPPHHVIKDATRTPEVYQSDATGKQVSVAARDIVSTIGLTGTARVVMLAAVGLAMFVALWLRVRRSRYR